MAERLTHFQQEQLAALEVVKEWLEEVDGAVIAVDELVVYRGRKPKSMYVESWIKLTMPEATKLIKGTRMPLALMKYCNNDLIRAAAQETDRIYERAVSTMGFCHPNHFNYLESTQINPYTTILFEIMRLFEKQNANVRLAVVTDLFNRVLETLEVRPLPARQRNVRIREAAAHTQYEVRMYKQRYTYKGIAYSCLKLKGVAGMHQELSLEQSNLIVKQVVSASAFKKTKKVLKSYY